MKTFKLNFAFLCMLAMIAVSVCLTSCGKDTDIPVEAIATEATSELKSDEISLVFQLPEEYNKMSEQEIVAFFENTSEEEISKIMTVMSKDELEMRGCSWGPWEYLGTDCLNRPYCPGLTEVKYYRRKCTINWFPDYYSYAYGDHAGCC